MNLSILSERGYEKRPYYQVVYEWEDQLSISLEVPIKTICYEYFYELVKKIRRRLHKYKLFKNSKYRIFNKNKYNLFFVMNARWYYLFPTNNVIPVFLDFPTSMVDQIIRSTKQLPVYFVTCKDIYNMIQKRGDYKCRYMPLSIADKYFCEEVPKKKYDVIQFGRKNPILHKYMLKYCQSHSNVEYIYQSDNGDLTYYSTTRGIIGTFDTRDSYMELIRASRISLVSTPSIDCSRTDFGNIDFVTPRFFESAAAYCHLIGRYTENEETEELRLNTICNNINSYKEFENLVDRYLNLDEWDWSIQKSFVVNNLTSVRAKLIQREVIKEIHNLKK